MQQWHVIYTQPKKEHIVNRQLEQRDLEVFFPVLQFERGYGRGIRVEPFFPNYLFVYVDLMAGTSTGLRWLAGVRGIVEVGSEPAVVPESVITALRARLDPMADRVVRKTEWSFEPGQKVHIIDGPFKGFDAVFQKGLSGQQRVQVLLDFLGNHIRTTLHPNYLEVPQRYPA